MICKRCPDHPTRTPSPDGTHTCPSCGSEVHLRDAGYERFTEMPLRMPMRETPLAVSASDENALVCSDTRTGPGCGMPYVPSHKNATRCRGCMKSKRWPTWKLDLIAVAVGDAWQDIAMLPQHRSHLPTGHWAKNGYRKPPAENHPFGQTMFIGKAFRAASV